jgi:AbrB family looped-hinge helix DNA binding protein
MNKIVRGKEIRRRVISQGNSLMVTIPSAIIDRLGIREGDPIKIETDGKQIVIEKIRPVRDPEPLGGDICQH